MKSKKLFIAFILLMASCTARAQGLEPKMSSLPVRLTVQAGDNIRDMVISYVSRELRALRDVRIVEDQPMWEIDIVAVEVKNTAGNKMGIAMSVIFIKPLNNILNEALSDIDSLNSMLDRLTPFIETYCTRDTSQYMRLKRIGVIATDLVIRRLELEQIKIELEGGLGFCGLANNKLLLGSTDDLKELCEQLVAEFDTKYLTLDRELYLQSK
jgi:hypothetical protein